MTLRHPLAGFLALYFLAHSAEAAKVYGGSGIGFSNDDAYWVATLVFEKSDKATVWTQSDTFKGKEISVQTGDILTPTGQTAPVDQWDLATIAVPHTTSTSWCDPAIPDTPGNTDFAHCYGNAKNSMWFIIDMNGLYKAGLQKVTVTVTAQRFDDGVATETDGSGHTLPGDDDLVPALTVFRGRQDTGAHANWYPNRFQQKRFWAWNLTPFDPPGRRQGFATAFGSAKANSATVTGPYDLKGGNQNYLTVAVGGDARPESGSSIHPVNFKLTVSIYAQDPRTDGIFANTTDACGCEKGQTWWHLEMGHCMSIALCKKPEWANGPPGHRCQTPAECTTNGGRWACGQKGVVCK
ncbi:MAG: hypothetical protein FIA97_02075 [Methylococcaceae bacterium]|nr:hypothetical protein [Methylococcaceae bacterium]